MFAQRSNSQPLFRPSPTVRNPAINQDDRAYDTFAADFRVTAVAAWSRFGYRPDISGELVAEKK
jgi:hypothetical protein